MGVLTQNLFPFMTSFGRSIAKRAFSARTFHESTTGTRACDPVGTKENEMLRLLVQKNYVGVQSLLQELDSRGEVTLFAYNIALRACAERGDADGALNHFKALQLKTNGGADYYSFGSLASALCRAGRVDEAASLLHKMGETRMKPNTVILNTLLHGAVTARRTDLADWIRMMMRNDRVTHNEMTLIGVVRLAALHRRAELVTSAWHETLPMLFERKQKCTRAAVSALAVAYSQCGRPELAMQAIGILTETFLDCSDVISPSVLRAAVLPSNTVKTGHSALKPINDNYGRSKQEGPANGEYDPESLVQDRNLNAQHPKQLSKHVQAAFDSTASAYSRVGDDLNVSQVVQLLEKVGGLPQPATIIARIKGLVRAEIANQRNVSRITGNNRVGAQTHATNGDPLLRVEHIVERDLARSGLKPTTHLHNALLREQARIGGVAAARAQWERMLRNKLPFRPDAVSYGTMLAAHAKEKDVTGAWQTWEAMKNSMVSPDEACIVSLIATHARQDKEGSADPRVLRVVEELQSLGRSHTVATGTGLARVLGQLGLGSEAFRLIQGLRDAGLQLETRSYNALLHVINDCHMGMAASVETLREMILSGCQPDNRTFTALISNSMHPMPVSSGTTLESSQHMQSLVGRLASFFLAMMLGAGLNPSVDTFNALLRSAMHSNRLSTARDALLEMGARGVIPNDVTIYTIVGAARRNLARHSQDELNWLLEQCICLGARPKEKLFLSLISAAQTDGDLAQAVWYVGIAVTYRLAHPTTLLRAIQDLDIVVFDPRRPLCTNTTSHSLHKKRGLCCGIYPYGLTKLP